MDKNELKKDLYKSKNMAKFSHYASGKLYYNVDVLGANYLFPIDTVDKLRSIDDVNYRLINVYILSEDLGSTAFSAEIKGSELIRWITKAIDSNDFIKIIVAA